MTKVIQIEKNQTYAIYCGNSHRSLAGGLTPDEARAINEVIGNDGFYCVINKRNGEIMPDYSEGTAAQARIMQKDVAIAFAKGWDGTMAVKDNVYLAQARKGHDTAAVVKGNTLTIIDGRPNKEFKETVRSNNVVGNEHIKRELGSYTDSWQEKLYVAGYKYSSIKSPIINKPTTKIKPPEKDYVDEWMTEGLRFIKANPTAKASKIMRSIGWPASIQGQQRFVMVKKIRQEARRLNLC